MDQITELPEETKRLLRNLEARSDNVVSDAIEALGKSNDPDPRVILTLRRRANEKRGWLFQVRDRARDVADRLSNKADKRDVQLLEDFILKDEMPDRDVIVRLIRLQLENKRKLDRTIRWVTWFYIAFMFAMFSLSHR